MKFLTTGFEDERQSNNDVNNQEDFMFKPKDILMLVNSIHYSIKILDVLKYVSLYAWKRDIQKKTSDIASK